jgi:hypothetical protein
MARKKRAAPVEAEQPEAAPQPQYFESVLGEGVQSIYQTVMGMKQRGTPGALRHGVTGAHIIIQEILDNANNQQAYLTIAAYAVAAALLGTGWWELPTIQPSQEDLARMQGQAQENTDGATDGELVADGATENESAAPEGKGSS